MKQRIATVLLVLGLLVTGTTAVVAYLARTVLDREAFTSRLVEALGRPGVSNFVAQRIADGVIAANRDLTGVRPVITTFAHAVVNSTPFHVLARRGAEEAHQVLFSEGARNVMLSVPDVGVLLRSTLETVSPDVASRVPANLRTVIETRLTGTVASRVVATLRLAGRIRLLARIGLVLGLLLIITAVALAPARRQAILNAGLGLLAIAAVLALIVPLGRATVTGSVGDPALRAAIADLWTSFTIGLRTWAIGIGTVSLMLLAGTAALLDKVTLRGAIRRGVEELGGRQTTGKKEALRILILIVLGAFTVAAPLATLAVATVVLGAAVLALAMYELVALVAPHRALEEGRQETLRLNPALGVALACVLLTVSGFGAAALIYRFRPDLTQAMGRALQCSDVGDLCDRTLDQVVFPGAHNAMGSADNASWMFPNQDASIRRLLRQGVRAFMLDVTRGLPVGDAVKTDFASEDQRRKYEKAIGPEAFSAAMRIRDRMVGMSGDTALYMCHGFCELGAVRFDSALAAFKEFLVARPTGLLMLVIEDYVPAALIAAAFERHGLIQYAYTGPSRGPFPTIRELVRTNQRLFVMGEHDTGGIPWYHPAFEVMQETPYTFHTPEEFSCRANRGEQGNPILLMNHWIETTPAPKPSNARIVNAEAFLVARARECERERGKLPNVIAVDFAGTGDVVNAAWVLNGLREPAPPDTAAAPTPRPRAQ